MVEQRVRPDRAAARLGAVQALYQMDVSGKGLTDVLAEFESHWLGQEIEGDEYKPAETAFFRDVLSGVLEHQRVIDPMVDDALAAGWPLKRIDSVMRAILRAGVYELRNRKDVPARVVIKEYVDVAGGFFGREEAGMINAVLDALARRLRADEFQ
ncbi:MAG: transcription antitermination factor NusB [Rhizobiales bacterium]|nr:transcription antitermination factor NusB [Hyphomicrobiales bacterium]